MPRPRPHHSQHQVAPPVRAQAQGFGCLPADHRIQEPAHADSDDTVQHAEGSGNTNWQKTARRATERPAGVPKGDKFACGTRKARREAPTQGYGHVRDQHGTLEDLEGAAIPAAYAVAAAASNIHACRPQNPQTKDWENPPAGADGPLHGSCASIFSITVRQHRSLRNTIEAIPEADWKSIPYWMEGAADVAETTYMPFKSAPGAVPVRLIVRRVKPTPGSQLALFASYSYHAFITDRAGETLDLEADHRRHAEIENAIRDPASSTGQALKYGVGLNHLPSGRFPANGAWLAVQVMAHNLARWTTRIGLGEQLVTTKTLRRRFFSLARRLTHKAPHLTLHLPQGWPWQNQFSGTLERLRTLPFHS